LQLIRPPRPCTGRRARLHLGAAHHQGDGRILRAGHCLHGRGGHRLQRVVLTGVFALQRPGPPEVSPGQGRERDTEHDKPRRINK